MSYGESNQTEYASSWARGSIQDAARFADGRSDSACTTLQLAPPSLVFAMPFHGASPLPGSTIPRSPTYATSGKWADAAIGPSDGSEPFAVPQPSPRPTSRTASSREAFIAFQLFPSSSDTWMPPATAPPARVSGRVA